MTPARRAFTGAALVLVILTSSLAIVSTLPLHASTPTADLTATAQAERANPGPRLNPVSNTPLNMRFTNAPLTRILSFIGSVTGIAITYENGFVDIPKVTIDVKEATFEEALNQILTPNRLSYKVVDERSILIVRRVQ